MKQVLFTGLLFFFSLTNMLAQTNVCEEKDMPSNEQTVQDSTKISIAVYDNQLFISKAPENAVVEVKNMLGENVKVYRLKSSEERINLDLKKGFYIIRVENYLQRIIIK